MQEISSDDFRRNLRNAVARLGHQHGFTVSSEDLLHGEVFRLTLRRDFEDEVQTFLVNIVEQEVNMWADMTVNLLKTHAGEPREGVRKLFYKFDGAELVQTSEAEADLSGYMISMDMIDHIAEKIIEYALIDNPYKQTKPPFDF